MAINYPNWLAAPIQKSPFENLFENVLKGYQMQQEPAKMREEQNARQQANALKKLELEHNPKEYELNDKGKEFANALQGKALQTYDERYKMDKQLKQANIDKANRPASGMIKPNGDVANIAWVHDQLARSDLDTDYRDQLKAALTNHQEKVEEGTKRTKVLNTSQAVRGMPASEKKWSLAMGRGMGIDPTEMQRMLNAGKTVPEIAKDLDIPLAEVKPKYAPGEEMVKQNQKRDAFTHELDSMENNMGEAMGKYKNLLFGYSLEQVADAAKGDDPDTQGKVLAARALQPELAAIRLKMANANIGIESIKELQSKSLGNLKIVEGLVDSDAYAAMQKYMNKWLREASDAFGDAIDKNGQITPWGEGKASKNSEKSSDNGSHAGKTYDLATGAWK